MLAWVDRSSCLCTGTTSGAATTASRANDDRESTDAGDVPDAGLGADALPDTRHSAGDPNRLLTVEAPWLADLDNAASSWATNLSAPGSGPQRESGITLEPVAP